MTLFLQEAQQEAEKKGLQYIAICGLRSWEEQERLYAKGRTAPGARVTNARPGSSMHNYGLAIDCGVFLLKKYLDAGTPADQKMADMMHKAASVIAEQHGLRWGGNFKSLYDAPHFELKVEHTVQQLAELRRPGQWVPV
jgi:peptidoglycan L-alanyl-D-glutamate endopeptidase CwlK